MSIPFVSSASRNSLAPASMAPSKRATAGGATAAAADRGSAGSQLAELSGTGVGLHVEALTKVFWQYKQRGLLSKPSGAFHALGPLSMDVAPGEFVSIVGPSGCGKSTLLWIVGDLLKATSGSVEFTQAQPASPAVGASRRARRRNPSTFVFQDVGLLPWRSARDNVAFALERRGSGPLGRLATSDWDRVDATLDLVGLAKFRTSLPSQLSGGMQQRVAIARALVGQPGLLLMDEPFGALDAQTRTLMQGELLRLWHAWRGTVVFVTHDIDEAIYLADRVVVMGNAPGHIIKTITVPFDRPRELIETRNLPEFSALRNDIWHLLHPNIEAEV
jgi:NitT/TauT family transport system ATP-binding protein